ncbi:cyclin-like F-box [Hypoxylon sp. NC1633]|nr:cyclin-like F-box [Hypoxylon sp. NC1633]
MASPYNCLLCGIGILSTPPTESEKWLREYRAVYRDSTGSHVTGVGFYDGGPSWKAPRDPTLRWEAVKKPEDQLEVPVIGRRPAGGLHGFVIHDACWNMVQKVGGPAGFSIERMVCVCESLPNPLWFNGLSWGHDYGGILELEVDDAYPWLERFPDPSIETIYDIGAMEDPFDGTGIRNLLSAAMTYPPKGLTLLSKSTDPFSRLPVELREMIAMSLRTQDALNLRLTSRSFLFLISNFVFWSSRFHFDGERGFLFEVREATTVRDVNELLHLYRLSRRSVATPELLNRERVWKLAQGLVPIIQPLVENFRGQQPCLSGSSRWVRIAGQEQKTVSLLEWTAFWGGCRPTTMIDLRIPNGAVKIGIALVNTGIWDYVTGIRIVDRDGHEQMAGYAFDKNEIACDVTALHGFRVAMGPGGVRALQIMSQGRQACRWIGRTDGVPQSERLVTEAPVVDLSVTLDGYKVTALAVSVNQPSQAMTPYTAKDLRHAALWYPDVPPTSLMLNKDSFTGQDPLSAGYQPLSWIHFGGSAGKSLCHIQGILAQFSDSLHGLQFVYDEAHGSRYSDKLGRCKETSLRSGPLFPIDGPGGERIEMVCVGTRRNQIVHATTPVFLQHGVLKCIKVMSFRSCRTTCIGKTEDDLQMRPLRIVPGTTLTGFYGHYACSITFIS